jgi:hypothetical protein
MNQEIWKPVVGHEGAYEVSNLGQVRSLDRLVPHRRKTGTFMRKRKGQMLRPGRKACGHVSVAVGKGNSVSVHVLVLEAFVGPRPDGQEACHQNDVPDDNRLENLSWGTRSKNLLDAVRNGKKAVGEEAYNAKLKSKDIPIIRARLMTESYEEIAKDFGVCASAIGAIKTKKTWKSVTGEDA